MKAVLQRVCSGRVTVDGETIGAIGPGYVILVGIGRGDGQQEVLKLAEKTVHLRVFPDQAGKSNLSALDVGAEVLVVSQFTLCADTRKGRRPSFTQAAPPAVAEGLVAQFVDRLRQLGLARVETGQFGAKMVVSIENDGPVTIILDTNEL